MPPRSESASAPLTKTTCSSLANGFGQDEGQFVWPVAMTFDSRDRLYITDEYNHRVVVYDADGEFISQWGERGSDPGQMDGPAGIGIDGDDNLYVADQHKRASFRSSPLTAS